MKNVNKVILLGNVTRDAELRKTATGVSVATFGLATRRAWRDDQGERHSAPEFHALVLWGAYAEGCAQHITQGKPLYIEGYLRTSEINRRDGSKDRRTEILVEELVFVGQAATAA